MLGHSAVVGLSMQQGELVSDQRCEGYRIVRLIGAGGMGEVYEAVHEESGQVVALKCLKVRHRFKEDARARMKMEAVVLAELQHANLVQVYDAGLTDSGAVWIAMELLHGETLRDRLYRTGALPISDALYIGCEVADGVDAVHSVNVIHRDLKPENIFITHTNQVKVLDLGTGKFTGYGLNSTDRMRILGTTAYMSPEQLKGLRVDARADVYALGLIVYETLTGRHALLSASGTGDLPNDVETLAIMQLQTEPVVLSDLVLDIPPYLASVVTKAIAKDREQRYRNMGELGRDLRAARKRFLAEHGRSQVRARRQPVPGDVRHKLGANLPDDAPLKSASPIDSEPPVSPDGPTLLDEDQPPPPIPIARNEFEAQARGISPALGSRPAASATPRTPIGAARRQSQPAATGRGPQQVTEVISQACLPPAPGPVRIGSRPPPALGGPQVQTTHTNPFLADRPEIARLDPGCSGSQDRILVRSLPLEPHAPRRWWRRLLVTVGLSALVGIPPALLSVWVVGRWNESAPPSSSTQGASPTPPASEPRRTHHVVEPPPTPLGVVVEAAEPRALAPQLNASAEPSASSQPAAVSPIVPRPTPASPSRRQPAKGATTTTTSVTEEPSPLAAPDWNALAPGSLGRPENRATGLREGATAPSGVATQPLPLP